VNSSSSTLCSSYQAAAAVDPTIDTTTRFSLPFSMSAISRK
jgi:hypothetical protein